MRGIYQIGGSRKHKTTWALGRSSVATKFLLFLLQLLHYSTGLFLHLGGCSGIGLKQEREKVAHQVVSSRKRHTGVPARHCLYSSQKVQTNPICLGSTKTWNPPRGLASHMHLRHSKGARSVIYPAFRVDYLRLNYQWQCVK